jgi:hypothetical protein
MALLRQEGQDHRLEVGRGNDRRRGRSARRERKGKREKEESLVKLASWYHVSPDTTEGLSFPYTHINGD